MEKIVEFLRDYGTKNEIITFIISMVPIFELRGAIPLALLQFKFPVLKAYIISVLGNILPVLPIIYFLEPIRKTLSKIKIFKKFFDWIYRTTYKKSEKNIMKYGAVGLALFVAIPLPMTGAWSGSIAAIIFDIKPKYALPSIIAGVLIAGLIVSFIVKGFSFL